MRGVALEHLAPGVGAAVPRHEVAFTRVPRRQRLVHGGAELGRAEGTNMGRLELVGRRRHAPGMGEAVAHRAQLEIVELGEAQVERCGGLRGRLLDMRLQCLEAVEHRGHDGAAVLHMAVRGLSHRELELLRLDHRRRLWVSERPAEDLREMVVLFERARAELVRIRLFARRRHVERVLGPRQADVHDAPSLPDRKLHGGRTRRRLDVPRVLLAAPALHHEPKPIRVEEQPLRVARARRPQVDHEHDGKLEALGRVDREERDRLGAVGLLGRLADGKLGVDHLVQVADEVADPGEREIAFEASRELEHLAQVQQRPRAAVAMGAQLRPAEVAALLEQAVEDIADREGVPQETGPVGELDEPHGLRGHARVHLREALARRFVETVAQPHSPALEAPGGEPVHARVGKADDRALQQPDERAVVHRVLSQAQEG